MDGNIFFVKVLGKNTIICRSLRDIKDQQILINVFVQLWNLVVDRDICLSIFRNNQLGANTKEPRQADDAFYFCQEKSVPSSVWWMHRFVWEAIFPQYCNVIICSFSLYSASRWLSMKFSFQVDINMMKYFSSDDMTQWFVLTDLLSEPTNKWSYLPKHSTPKF